MPVSYQTPTSSAPALWARDRPELPFVTEVRREAFVQPATASTALRPMTILMGEGRFVARAIVNSFLIDSGNRSCLP